MKAYERISVTVAGHAIQVNESGTVIHSSVKTVSAGDIVCSVDDADYEDGAVAQTAAIHRLVILRFTRIFRLRSRIHSVILKAKRGHRPYTQM